MLSVRKLQSEKECENDLVCSDFLLIKFFQFCCSFKFFLYAKRVCNEVHHKKLQEMLIVQHLTKDLEKPQIT